MKYYLILQMNGLWLSTKEKKFYKLQVESNGKVGYVTSKSVPTHPSKCIKDKETVVRKIQHQIEISYSSKTETETDDDYAPSTSNICRPTRKRKASTASAVSLVKNVKLSIHQSKKVCYQL